MDITEVKDRMRRSQTRRAHWEMMWQDCIDYCMPARQGFYREAIGQEKTDRVFDETPIQATDEFASRMQSAILPPARKWFRLEVAEVVPEAQRVPLQEQLDQVSDYLWYRIVESNLDAESAEALLDIAIGTTAIQADLDPLNKLVFRTAALPTVWIDEAANGRIGGIYRERTGLTAEKIAALYPKANALPADKNKEYKLCEATVLDESETREEVWQYWVWIDNGMQVLQQKEYRGWGSCPWIGARWASTAEEWYGRGPLINLLPAIRSVNLTRELIYENAEMAIGGIWQYDDDGTINPEQIQVAPNTFIPVAPGSQGLRPVQSPARFDIAEANLQDLRQTIKRGLFSEEFTPTGKTPLSAQEIAERQADLAQRMGAPFSRILKELVQPLIMRIARLYVDAGLIEMPMIDGKIIRVVSTSPLARAQKIEEITRSTQFISTLTQFMGPQAAGTYIKTEPTTAYLADLYEFPARLLHDNDSRVEEVEQGQALQAKLETGLQVLPTEQFQQRVEKGPLQRAA